jgi:gluconate kinase
MFLKGDKALIAARMARRKGHYMPPKLLDSQVATLEEPGPDERPLVVPIDGGIDEMIDSAEQVLMHAAVQG